MRSPCPGAHEPFPRMIPALAACFPEPLAYYKDAIALPGEHAATIPGTDLMDADAAQRIFARYAETYPGADRHALVSMWTQWYFGALIIPVTAATLRLDRDLPVELDRIGIALHESGRPAALIVADEGKPHGAGAQDRFARLFRGHIDPLVRQFAEHFDVSRRLLWINAAAIFEWTIEQVAAAGQVHAAALEEAKLVLERRTDAEGRPNLMFGAVRYPVEDGCPVRRRKVCCLRYLLPGVAHCDSLCPLPEVRRG